MIDTALNQKQRENAYSILSIEGNTEFVSYP